MNNQLPERRLKEYEQDFMTRLRYIVVNAAFRDWVSMRNDTLRLKAAIFPSKSHYVQKVIQYQQTIDDAFKGHINSTFSIFVPKLKLEYPTPCVMLYVKNGNGRCLIRSKDPNDLANQFDRLSMILRSELWTHIWMEMDSVSWDIIDNNFVNDPKFIDMG